MLLRSFFLFMLRAVVLPSGFIGVALFNIFAGIGRAGFNRKGAFEWSFKYVQCPIAGGYWVAVLTALLGRLIYSLQYHLISVNSLSTLQRCL